MKNNYNTKVRLLVFTFLCSVLSWGQVTIFQFNFESGTAPSIDNAVGIPAYSTLGTLTTDAGVCNGVASIAHSAWNTNDGYRFTVNTTGYSTLNFSYVERTSNVAISTFLVRASLDGSAWTTIRSSYTPPTSCTNSGLISLPIAFENQSNVYIEILKTSNAGSSGNIFRLDDVTLTGLNLSSNTITTSTTIAGSPYCVSASTGASVSVPFTSTGTFTAGNVYTAQLSNAAGTFGSPVSIGTVSSNGLNPSGTISATIPAGTAAGTGYRIRVISSTPSITGSDNTLNLTVQNTAAITAQPSTTIQNLCQGASATALSVTATGTTLSYQWYSNTTATNSGGTSVGTSASYTPVTTTAGTLYYYCEVTAACGAMVPSNVSGAVNVTSVPSTPSGTINVSANPSCGAATLSYSAPSANIYWQTAPGNTSTTNNTLTNYTSSATANTYTIYVRELIGTCWSPAISVTFTVQNAAAITAQPSTTVQNLCQGASATALSVTATGTTLSYQWYSNTTATNSGGTAVGTNSASYTPVTTTAGTLYYYCEVTAACGAMVPSNVSGAVNVTSVPSTPSGTISISANPSCGAATLTYSAPSSNIYWQTTAGGTSTGSPTTSNYTSLATANTYTIYVREKNGSCWSSAISVTFTVAEPVVITAQPPVNRTITDGSNTTFTVSATGTGLTFQWQVDTGSGFNDISLVAPYSAVTTGGVTKTNTLTITAAPITMNGYVYRCVISGAAPCGSVTSNSGSLTVTLTQPNNPTVIVPCYGNNTLGLSWTASTFGATPAPDGYMVFALAGGTTPAATSAVAGNANLYTANSDFSLATVVTASLGKCLYKGTGTSFTVTGLANLSSYSFKVVAYRGTTGTVWSSGINTTGTWNTPATNITIDIPEVTSFAASIANNQSALTWSNPIPSACYDQYLIVANQGTVVFTPSGDGSAYTANSVYSTSNQVVYKGIGTGVTVAGLTNGTNYCYKVFVRKGTEWSDGVSVCQTPNIVYCALTATDTGYEHITNVTVGADINNNTASSGYANYTAQVANTTIGSGTAISVTVTPSYATDNVYVYIDWNKDGDWLDIGENITMTYTAVTASFTATATIIPPVTALIGNTRMRVIVVDGTVSNACNGGANFTYGEVEDYTINVLPACVPTHAVTSFTPTSGPVGTEVTINGTSLTGATVSFSGINATIVSNSGTQIVVIIPTGATTGMLSVKDSQPCSIDNSFTILKNDKTSCEGFLSDLIIYEVYDEERSSGGTITIFNGTLTTKNLANYRIYRAGTYGGAYSDFANLTGSIAPGALGIIKVTGSDCGPAATNGSISGGFNDFDGLQLRLSDGTTVVDDVQVPGYIGYYMKRSPGNYLPRTTFVGSDWTTVDVGEVPVGTNECLPMGTPPSVTGDSPAVTTHPTYSPSCGSTSVILNTAGTEGYAGGNTLAYQWYFAAPGSATWTVVTDGGIYSGATTASLNISVVTGVINYQYYCQIRENLATCYSATNAVKITDTSASTWNGSTWIGGTPTITKAAIIDGTYITATNGNFSCCSLTVNSGVGRSLTISSGGYVEVQNNITNNGILDVLNDGSLVQISDAGVNTGNVFVKRTANVRLQDYSYWSAPVSSATGTPVYPITSVSPSTPLGVIWKWGAASPNANGGEGMWLNTTENMVKGTGYAVRGPSGTSNATTTPMNANFSGVPNNGVIPVTIARGSDLNAGTSGPNGIMRTIKDDNFNLIGNPYPSAIDADLFIARYAVVSSPDYADIEGSVRIWSHNTLPLASNSNPFYANYQMNYSANDYITYNSLGSQIGPATYLGKIPSGQGFFVLMKDGVAGTNTINFRNALRSKTFDNSQFFKTTTSNTNVQNNTVQKHRIWLDIISPTNSVTRTLIGYATDATNGLDNTFDAITDSKMTYNLYSIVNNEVLTIQGRALPFDIEDKVQMGVKIASPGLYKIAIATADGIFSNSNNSGQKIYLEDKDLNIIHDLTIAPYQFNGMQGKFESRFVIRYNNGTVLSNETFDANNDVVVVSNQELSVLSTKEKIANIVVYDVLGRKLFEGKDIKINNFTLPISKHNVPLFIEIGLESGIKINRKVVY